MGPFSSRVKAFPLRTALAVAAAAALTAGGGVAFASAGGTGAGVAAQAAHVSGAVTATKQAARPRVVRPGQRIRVAPNGYLSLSEKGISFKFGPHSPIDAGGTWTLNVSQVRRGAIEGPGYGSSTQTVDFGIYRGSGLARVVFTMQGRPVQTQVLTLPGHPGWAAYLAVGPGNTVNGPVVVTITGYDAKGHVLVRQRRG
jgi:hypothetical protein